MQQPSLDVEAQDSSVSLLKESESSAFRALM